MNVRAEQDLAACPSKRQEFARGWPVLVGAMLCYMISIVAIPAYTSGVYLKPLVREFDVGRATMSSTSIIGTIVIMVMAPTVGGLADRYGVRRLLAASLLGMAAIYFLQATVMRTFADYVGLMILLYVFGAATLPVVFTRTVNAWFDRARGLALACALTGTGITAVAAPPVVTEIISKHGWQTALGATGLLVLLLTPVIVWLVRMPPDARTANGAIAPDQQGVTLQEALRTPHFWFMAVAFALQVTAALGLSLHLIPMLTDKGLSPLEAAGMFSLSGVAIILGRLLVGPLLDVFFAPRLAAIIAATFAAGCLMLVFGGIRLAPIAALTTGLALGAEVDFVGYLASRYYGLRHYGRIYGCLYSAFAIGAGTGGIWVGAIYDITGSYDGAYLVAAALMIPTVILLLLLPRYPDGFDISGQSSRKGKARNSG